LNLDITQSRLMTRYISTRMPRNLVSCFMNSST